ncbi:hypothetical protein KQ306_12465 [Synechococcus sp. CS-1324]|uniref:hypothetical protein n=1 Tax=unclassified Synechococcus TaxID=2626047 RepID=UPI000DB5C494|nr:MULTISPECIES: hypothetical protein [unclassified Synechococcus]MCT0213420.1 hypothetical protein [Synechococcus sp. CS-1326]MCT0231658.1 hypothetical protein [Synechococcus sp. CS-1324]MCT0232726.1 hypothetical protein [Synechococcus sp. CS-1327]PZV03549.1 MAG: hypothetical protein DCF23_09010 [Cyanobium sp.]
MSRRFSAPIQSLVRRAGLGLLAAVSVGAASAWAQADFPFNLQRATNLARMKAEKLNGGLGVYRTAACMFDRAAGNCIIETGEQGILFRFLGGPPGWQQLNLAATVETELRISPDGRTVLAVLYNGPIRLSTPSEPGQRPQP